MAYSPIPKDIRAMFSRYSSIQRLPEVLEKIVIEPFISRQNKEFMREISEKMKLVLDDMKPTKITVAAFNTDYHRLHLLDLQKLILQVSLNPIGFNHDLAVERCINSLVAPVSSARQWAPNTKVNGRLYIPQVFLDAESTIKDMLKDIRRDINELVESFIVNRLKDGWKTISRSKPAKFELADVTAEDLDVLLSGTSMHQAIVLAKEIEDKVKDEDGNTRHHVHMVQLLTPDIEARKDPAPDEDAYVITMRSVTRVVLNGVIVSLNDYLRDDWTLLAIMSEVPNAEERRVLMQRFGFAKLLETCNSEVIEMDDATTHVEDKDAPSITRALLAMKAINANGNVGYEYRIVVGTDGSTGRVYYMPATDSTGRHCQSLEEWDRLVGQPKRLYAQA